MAAISPGLRHEPLLVTEQLRRHAQQYADKIALADEVGAITYQQLWAGIETVAGALQDAGLAKGDRVATAMSPTLAHIVVVLGAMAGGFVPCILNTRLTAPELERFLAPIEPALVVADATHAPIAAGLGPRLVVLAAAEANGPLDLRLAPLAGARPRTADLAETDLAIIIPTGGTTGLPKGAVWSHRGLFLWLASSCLNATRISDDVELYFQPFFHVSSFVGWMTSLFTGATVRVLRQFSVERAIAAIGEDVTVLMGAVTLFTALRADPRFAGVERGRVRMVIIGGSAITSEFLTQLAQDFPQARFMYRFGATEHGPVTGMQDRDLRSGRTMGVGRPLPGCRVTVVDEAMNPLPPGEVGEFVVTSLGQAAGYWGRPEETAATFTPLGVRLGDLGSIADDGWVTVAGRKKEMIKTGGENVFPNEVEAVLSRHPAVREVCVYGVPDPYWGERVEAAVALAPGAALTREELATFARAELAGYKLPKTLRIVDEVPLTSNHKADRRRLSEAAAKA